MLVVGPDRDLTVAVPYIHPPIDRVLLKGLAEGSLETRSFYLGLSWTTLHEDRYFELIERLRKNHLHEPAFWMLEWYWDLSLPDAGDVD